MSIPTHDDIITALNTLGNSTLAHQDAVAAYELIRDTDAALRVELQDVKTQCGKNAVSHMTESQRAERLQAKLTDLEGEA